MECSEQDFLNNEPSCNGTFKDNLRKIILQVKASNKTPLLAKVPYGTYASDPSDDQVLIDYNVVIDQLVGEHNIMVTPPDFYSHFKNNQSELFDDKHPNGFGYQSMADLWYDALVISGILAN
jgi:lysophospholipase L1-like esterase